MPAEVACISGNQPRKNQSTGTASGSRATSAGSVDNAGHDAASASSMAAPASVAGSVGCVDGLATRLRCAHRPASTSSAVPTWMNSSSVISRSDMASAPMTTRISAAPKPGTAAAHSAMPVATNCARVSATIQ